MRTSSGTPPQNGWVLTSSRPASKSKPSTRITCTAQRALRVDRERPLRRDHGLAGLARLHVADQPGSHCAGRRTRGRPGAGHAGLEAVHQRVVGAQAGLLRQQRASSRPWPAPRGSWPGSRPSRWPGAGCARRARSARWPAAGAAPAPRAAHWWRAIRAHLAQVGALHVVQRLAARRAASWRQRGVGAHAVQQRGHLGHRGGARLVALAGGMLAAWSQPAMDCRWSRRCSGEAVASRRGRARHRRGRQAAVVRFMRAAIARAQARESRHCSGIELALGNTHSSAAVIVT
jgi:hypothetical protein